MFTVRRVTLAIRVCEGFSVAVVEKWKVEGQISFICISCLKYFI